MSILYPDMSTGVSGHQKSCPVRWKKQSFLVPFECLPSNKNSEISNEKILINFYVFALLHCFKIQAMTFTYYLKADIGTMSEKN